MPERPMTIAAYAAGASLAAVTLVYVFAPTFFLDDDGTGTSRKRSAVGLHNPANDCFINSVLQALAGLGELRIYLIKELHRRQQDGAAVYDITAEDEASDKTRGQLVRLQGLRAGIVTQALKDMLDKLNERPICKKTISAGDFLYNLERAFGTRISRQQQDAQEMLHILAERLCDEYHAGLKARRRAKDIGAKTIKSTTLAGVDGSEPEAEPDARYSTSTETESPSRSSDSQHAADISTRTSATPPPPRTIVREDSSKATTDLQDEDNTFPFEGTLESQVECQTCHFKPKANVSKFVTLTLNVPQVGSTTLDSCFDGLLKLELIDDYACDRCRLAHAASTAEARLASAASPSAASALQADIAALRAALAADPEKPPAGVALPGGAQMPRRRVARHARVAAFPRILAVHLSRSIYGGGGGSQSSKNTARVAFAERLRLGGVVGARGYRLLAVITHKGGHNSGHYETFRRQSFQQQQQHHHQQQHHQQQQQQQCGQQGRQQQQGATASSSAAATRPGSGPSTSCSPTEGRDGGSVQLGRPVRGRRSGRAGVNDRWWRISDERVRECRMADVLAMQREVYLLFYELEVEMEAELAGGAWM